VGGIEVVPRAFAARLSTVRTGARAVAVDLDRKLVTLDGGEVLAYEHLVSTISLPNLLTIARAHGLDGRGAAARLDWSVVGCLNLGIDRPDVGSGTQWLYFPDGNAPFYRVGFPHAISGGVCPPGTSSLYIEFGLLRGEHADPRALEAAAWDCLVREGILEAGDRVLARDWIRIDPGYVIFDRARQEVMAKVVPHLDALGVRTIGRYGAWTYSYMERAILDGLETAAALARGA